MVVPIILVHFVPIPIQFWMLIVFFCLYMVMGSMTAPAWASLMSDIVPIRIIGLYFGRREMVVGISSLVFVLLMGFFLQMQRQSMVWGFITIFALAFIFRIVSSCLLFTQYDAPLHARPEHYFSFFQFLKKAKTGNFGKYVFFLSGLSFSVSFGSPYFAVYLLKSIHYGYIQYIIVTWPTFFWSFIKTCMGTDR